MASTEDTQVSSKAETVVSFATLIPLSRLLPSLPPSGKAITPYSSRPQDVALGGDPHHHLPFEHREAANLISYHNVHHLGNGDVP